MTCPATGHQAASETKQSGSGRVSLQTSAEILFQQSHIIWQVPDTPYWKFHWSKITEMNYLGNGYYGPNSYQQRIDSLGERNRNSGRKESAALKFHDSPGDGD